MSMNLAGGGRRRGGRRAPSMMHDINVTPMVDVMLVLLVIFMVAAPLLTVGVPVDLPNTKAPTLNTSEEPLVVTYTTDYKLFLQETPVEVEELTARLTALAQQNSDLKVYIRGDQGLSYGDMMGLMGDIRSVGIEHVALIGTMPEGGTERAMKTAAGTTPKPTATPKVAPPKTRAMTSAKPAPILAKPAKPAGGKGAKPQGGKTPSGKWGATSGPMPSAPAAKPATARG